MRTDELARGYGAPYNRLAPGLIDEYVLSIHPVAIGDGKRVFAGRVALELASAKVYQSGIVRVQYRAREAYIKEQPHGQR